MYKINIATLTGSMRKQKCKGFVDVDQSACNLVFHYAEAITDSQERPTFMSAKADERWRSVGIKIVAPLSTLLAAAARVSPRDVLSTSLNLAHRLAEQLQ